MTRTNKRLGVLPILTIAILTVGGFAGQAWSEAPESELAAESEDWYSERERARGDRPEFGRYGDRGDRGGRGSRGSRGGEGRHEHRGARPGGPGGVERLHMALRELDLSESQRGEIRAILEQDRDEAIASQERMVALAEDLEQQMTESSFDEIAVREKATALASVRVEMAVLRAHQLNQVRQVLTPDQLDQLEQMKQERKGFREERRERFERRRDGRGGF